MRESWINAYIKESKIDSDPLTPMPIIPLYPRKEQNIVNNELTNWKLSVDA